jgi:HEPN domain-containing protein
MSTVDFTASSTRHLRDASLLVEESRYDNALYLSGYAVECALKAVSGWSGLRAEMFGHKLVQLEGDGLELAMAISPATARYRPPKASVQAVSSTWSTNYRYYADGVTESQAKAILEHAWKVWESCVGEMFLDGLIQEIP